MPSPLALLALAAAQRSYIADPIPEPATAPNPGESPKGGKAKTVKLVRQPKATPIAQPTVSPTMANPSSDDAPNAVRKINAADFLAALPMVGKRTGDNGKPNCFDPIMGRRDEQNLIKSYVGYDLAGAHGAQLDAATRKARYEVRRAAHPTTEPIAPYQRSSAPTLAGYVKGMPQPIATRLADLLGREKLAADAKIEAVKLAKDKSLPISARRAHLATAHLEQQRLLALRADIAALGG